MTKTVVTKTVITKSIVAVVLSALSNSIWASTWAVRLLNDHATYETQRLYDNMAHLGHRVLFGHEDSLAYGVTWQRYGTGGALDSDIKQVTGAFPGVFGGDVGGIGLGHEKNLDGVMG